MEEIWKPIKGFESHYEISNYGNVRTFDRTKLSSHGSRSKLKAQFLKPVLQKTGYCTVCLSDGSAVKIKSIHRLVAIHFIDNPLNKPCVNHINSIRTDNRDINLEWVSYKENTEHAFNNNRMTNAQQKFIGINIKTGDVVSFNNIEEAAKSVEGNRANIHKCLTGKNNRVIAYGYKWEYCHISNNIISKIQSPIENINLQP